jgi:lysophospholipase L1-like esterase
MRSLFSLLVLAAFSFAAPSNWKFDFGNRAVENGYTGVSATEAYSASKGYGFKTPANMANVNASGSGALNDAVQFKTTDADNVFSVDLDRGLYQVTVWLGNTGRTSIKAEGMYQVMNMTGNNAFNTFQMPVTDGQLNIQATEGKAGNAYTMSALEITKISDNPVMKKTIWLCGNSTVCDYYPLESSTQAGWGQMLKGFIDSGEYEVRNMATGGQFAKGFLESGQFTPIEYYGKAGDIYVISIGINDANYSNRTEYYNAVTDMTVRAKAKGITVVLVKQQGRGNDVGRKPLLTGRWYSAELDQVGREQNVQVADLFNMWQTYAVSIGLEKTLEHYMPGDDLHPNRKGAVKLAEFMASVLPLSSGSIVQSSSSIIPSSSSILSSGSSAIAPLHGTLIKDLQILDSKNHGDWSIQDGLAAGNAVYGDREFTWRTLPPSVIGAEYIRTAADSKALSGDQATFKAHEDIIVTVLLDTRVAEQAWLSGWTKTAETPAKASNDNEEISYYLYQKDFASGSMVTLGTNGPVGSVINYAVAVKINETNSIVKPQYFALQQVAPHYYSLKGEPLGTVKPEKIGVYIMKQGNLIRKIMVK